MTIEAVELFFDGEFDAFSTCEAVLQLLEGAGLADSPFQIAGKSGKAAAATLVAQLRKRKDPFFWVDSDRVTLKTTPYRGGGAGFELKFRNVEAPAVDVLDKWIPTTLGRHGWFARLFDTEWEQWQNERQINKFELVGRSTAGLKRTWDPVFEEEVIDTSANSGRFVLREGYVECFGHQMWLAPAFWPLTGSKQEAVKKKLKTRRLPGEIVGVKLSERFFGDDNPIPEWVRPLLFPPAA